MISAPAMKHPGFVDMRTALLTSLLAQNLFNTSVTSFCIWTDSVLTCEMTIMITSHLHIGKIVTNTNLGVGVIDSNHSNIALDFIVNMSLG